MVAENYILKECKNMDFLYSFSSKSIKFLHHKSTINSIEKMMSLLKAHLKQITENKIEITLKLED